MDTIRTLTRNCGDESVDSGRGPGQEGWYQFARQFVKGKSVVDIGCGLGYGLDILRAEAASVAGQDLDPKLAGPEVQIISVEDMPSKSYDVVVSIDVIEHVPDPEGFMAHIVRIARQGAFLTTPNWTASRCQWPFHLREYTPLEFEQLLACHGEVTLYKGTPQGFTAYPVRHRRAYHAFNGLRNWWPTNFAARCINNVLPNRFRIHSHNAGWISLGRHGSSL